MDTAMDADAAVGEETPAQMDDAHVAPPAAEATMDAENPTMATTAAAKPSMAEMYPRVQARRYRPAARSRALRISTDTRQRAMSQGRVYGNRRRSGVARR